MAARGKPRRAPIDLQASILDCMVKEENPTLNRMVICAGVNQQRAKIHLDRLVAEGLIKAIKGSKKSVTYAATEDGIRWLRDYKNLRHKGGLSGRDKRTDDPGF